MSHDLDFVFEAIKSTNERLKTKRFLKSSFEDGVWELEYNNKSKQTINFDVSLKDGTSLIDSKNNDTLNTLKYWILMSTEPKIGIEYSWETNRINIITVLKLFDYINYNFDLSKHGFQNISVNLMKHFFDNLAKNRNTTEFIYDSNKRISTFLKKEISKNNPQKLLIEAKESEFKGRHNELNLTNDDFICSQLLIKNGLKLKDAFPNTLANLMISSKDFFGENILREYPYYYRNHTGKLSITAYQTFLNMFLTLGKIDIIDDIQIPNKKLFKTIKNHQVETKYKKRTETVESDLLFKTFCKATEFCLEYGDDIITSYENFINDYQKRKGKVKNRFIIQDSITPKLQELGVTNWLFNNKMDRYKSLRQNKNLKDLIDVYYGAVQFITGALSARRQSELASLKAFHCIDKENQQIIFKKSKSTKGLFGVKDVLRIPIDNLIIEQLLKLEKIQKITNNETWLFAAPSQKILKHNVKINYDTLDKFFDYIEIPVVDGKRKYIRQHQLRRFFAMVFFWGNGLGGLDNLRCFMGHTDVKHVYYYITENVSGSVLSATKAQYAAEHLKDNKTLENLVKERYNTDNVDIIDIDELTYFIEDLIEEGDVTVEPDFFENNSGEQYQILIKVTEKDND